MLEVSNILPAGMHACRQESIPACRHADRNGRAAIPLPADNTWACRGGAAGAMGVSMHTGYSLFVCIRICAMCV